MNQQTRDQLDRIRWITTTLAEGAHRAWLFGGWGLDARIGRVTRDHGDIEFWVDRNDALEVGSVGNCGRDPTGHAAARGVCGVRVGRCLVQHRLLRRPIRWHVHDRRQVRRLAVPRGPVPDEPVELQGLPVLAMSVVGMLAMKEQYPHLRNGRPWRDKDIHDIEVLRSMLADH